MDFTATPEAFGSGAKLTSEGWTIVAPSHTLESVFLCREGSKVFVSNALPFLLAHRDDALDPAFLDYHRVFFEILNGIDHSPIHFPSRRCKEIRGYYHDNLVIGPDLAITVKPKPLAPNFAAFADYRAYLARVLRAVFDNAADPARPPPPIGRSPRFPKATIRRPARPWPARPAVVRRSPMAMRGAPSA